MKIEVIFQCPNGHKTDDVMEFERRYLSEDWVRRNVEIRNILAGTQIECPKCKSLAQGKPK